MPTTSLVTKAFAVLAGIAALALLAGCGGGGSSSDNFVADANKICKDSDAQVKAIPKPTSPGEFKAYLDKAEPIVSKGVDDLKNLTPPDDKKSGYDAWIASLEKQEEIFGKAQDKAGSNPIAAAALVSASKPIGDRSNRLAGQIGLTECAKDNGGSSGSSGSS